MTITLHDFRLPADIMQRPNVYAVITMRSGLRMVFPDSNSSHVDDLRDSIDIDVSTLNAQCVLTCIKGKA